MHVLINYVVNVPPEINAMMPTNTAICAIVAEELWNGVYMLSRVPFLYGHL